MPEELRTRIERRSKETGRSANAEIVAIVTAALDAESHLASISAEVLIKELVGRLGASVQIVVPKDAAEAAGIGGAHKPIAKRRV